MTQEEYEAFAPHDNTWGNPYDSNTGRRVDVGVAMDLARNWLKQYGEDIAQMGLFNNIQAERVLERAGNIR